jgi:hypothetical protein
MAAVNVPSSTACDDDGADGDGGGEDAPPSPPQKIRDGGYQSLAIGGVQQQDCAFVHGSLLYGVQVGIVCWKDKPRRSNPTSIQTRQQNFNQ